jgi:glycosyltransferase involved in cell wall biosynthesis
MLILDTSEYAAWFTKNYNVNQNRFRLIPTGADDRIFEPSFDKLEEDGKFRVLYAGTYIPNHGVTYIIEAARALKSEPMIEFELIGEGPDLKSALVLADTYSLSNVRFIQWLSKDELITHINCADVCLGAFGNTPQSLMTVQNKIYEAIAMAKPLISGDSPAIRQIFKHQEHIYLCRREDGQSIAEAIVALWKNPSLRNTIAQNGYNLFLKRYRLEKNGYRLKQYIRELIA